MSGFETSSLLSIGISPEFTVVSGSLLSSPVYLKNRNSTMPTIRISDRTIVVIVISIAFFFLVQPFFFLFLSSP